MRFTSDGLIDQSFGENGYAITPPAYFTRPSGAPSYAAVVQDVIIDDNGSIYSFGSVGDGSLIKTDFAIAKYDSSGNLDGSFGSGGTVVLDIGFKDFPTKVLHDRHGNFFVSGYGEKGYSILKLDANGSYVPSFGENGVVTLDFYNEGNTYSALPVTIRSIAFKSNQTELVAVGEFGHFARAEAYDQYSAIGFPMSLHYANLIDEDGDGYYKDIDDCDDKKANVHKPLKVYADVDGDGYGDIKNILYEKCKNFSERGLEKLTANLGGVFQGGDCDDGNKKIHPGVSESCDQLDNDCNGEVDDGLTMYDYYKDQDGDGYSTTEKQTLCDSNVPVGYTLRNLPKDCDDTNPDLTENRNYYRDSDGDGYGINEVMESCLASAPEGYAVPPGTTTSVLQAWYDCDDGNPAVHPNKTENCSDGIDNNCNGLTDADDQINSYWRDADGDGFGDGNPSNVIRACSRPEFYVENQYMIDCDDTDPEVSPSGKPEICGDGKDNDCNGGVDDKRTTYYPDSDGDGFGVRIVGNQWVSEDFTSCTIPEGYADNYDDCDDTDATVKKRELKYRDWDRDGFGDPNIQMQICPGDDLHGSEYVLNKTDCDDFNVNVNSNAQEVCGDDIDNNCDGQVNEGCVAQQTDQDGYGHFVEVDDCDDSNDKIYSGAPEICDELDNDCDGQIDEDLEGCHDEVLEDPGIDPDATPNPNPGSENQTDPGSENQTDPGSENQTDPGSENQTDPGSENQTDPGSENQTDPGSENQTDPGSENQARPEVGAVIEVGSEQIVVDKSKPIISNDELVAPQNSDSDLKEDSNEPSFIDYKGSDTDDDLLSAHGVDSTPEEEQAEEHDSVGEVFDSENDESASNVNSADSSGGSSGAGCSLSSASQGASALPLWGAFLILLVGFRFSRHRTRLNEPHPKKSL